MDAAYASDFNHEALQEGRLEPHQRRRILIPAWEAAVEGGLVSLD